MVYRGVHMSQNLIILKITSPVQALAYGANLWPEDKSGNELTNYQI